ncbi:hypothetical protein NDA14_001884 [Ustilago hordei]|nr:hypothetical protein NDA14_001884 [Ustilago hordei]
MMRLRVLVMRLVMSMIMRLMVLVKVGGINTSVQCVDLMLEVIPGPQWTTAFGSILIWTANLLWAPSDVR